MKRCIICGHVGSDDSTVCEVCGNPYLDIRESDYSTEEDEQMDDADVVYEEDAAAVEDTYKAGNDEQEDAGTDFVQETAKESTQTENVNAEDHTAEAEYEPLDAFEASEEEDLAYVPQRKADEPDDAASQQAGEGTLGQKLRASFDQSSHGHGKAAAIAFLLFTLAYTPCLATVAEMRRQFGTKVAARSVLLSLAVAYVIAIIAFQTLRLIW